jgi:hypothetical protein
MPYIKVINIDKIISQRAESNWLYGVLSGFDRKALEVTNWTIPIAIMSSSGYGVFVESAGDYTVFRKSKADGTTNYLNHTVDCTVSQNIIFTVGLITPPTDGFNFRVAIQLIEIGTTALANFEYGYSLTDTGTVTNWQDANVFDLNDEGVYYFDVRIKLQTTTVGKQSVELALTDSGIIGGGDESDNPTPDAGTSED